MSAGRAGVATLLAAFLASAAVAQDTLPADSGEAPPRRFLPIPPIETPAGPLPPGARLTFTRDSLSWSRGYTLADLLGEIPGVYVARAGFTGQPEPVVFAGRGPTAIEIFWDGVLFLPVGPDSAAVDPGRISLFALRQVEVEVLPTALRVYLVSERHETATTRSVVRIVSGDFDTGAYAGLFQHRWPSGVGINVAADFLGTEGARDPTRDASWFDLWAKAEWAPSETAAGSFQIRREDYQRDPTTTGGSAVVPGREGTRTDAQLRFTSTAPSRITGWWVDAGMATTAWRPDSASPDTSVAPRTFRRLFAAVGARNPRASFEVRGQLGDHFTTATAEARVGWVPLPGIVVSADGDIARHRGDRVSRRAHAAVGLYAGPVFAVANVAVGSRVPAPALPGDTARRTTDYGFRAGLATARLSGSVAIVSRDAFQPTQFTSFSSTVLRPVLRSRYVVADATIRLGAFTLSGWYSNPTNAPAPDLQPPTHGRAALTFRSKFLRTFRSSAFDLKVQLAMESWSTGTAGVDAQGDEIRLVGATFYEGFIQFQIVQFQAFYSLKNAYNSREQFVPGLVYPRNIQTFGVKWVFEN